MSADIVGDLRRVEAERDALRAQVERVRALADEWSTTQRVQMAGGMLLDDDGNRKHHEVWYERPNPRRFYADDLRAALDGADE